MLMYLLYSEFLLRLDRGIVGRCRVFAALEEIYIVNCIILIDFLLKKNLFILVSRFFDFHMLANKK